MPKIRNKICFDMYTRNKDMICMSIATERSCIGAKWVYAIEVK